MEALDEDIGAWARRVRDGADWSDHPDGIVKGGASWQMEIQLGAPSLLAASFQLCL